MNANTLTLRAPAALPPGALDGPPGPPPPVDSPRWDLRRWITWQRGAVAALLVLTAVAYLWDLTASGYANSFYAAAVQAGTKSWKALFFGSLDPSSFITVDKPPASLWVMALSDRIFGFSSASMLVPQVLEGVASVALLYAAVRRWFGCGAGLAAGALLALTPVAALMFRFNNPDALLVLLLIASAYCLTRALENGATKWVVLAGTMIGFAFLAKMMQAFLVLPGFALVYLVAAPVPLRRRVAQTLAGGLAVVLSAGWWVAIVALWPAGSRPMIDGSSDNSILTLIFGYNGLGRIFGSTGPGSGGGGGGGGGANFSGSTGVLRLFNDLMGGQASWLLPAALVALGAGLIARRRAPRTDRTRAALLLWGGWLLVTALVFSLSSGIIHTYYTVALAPAIAALVAIGGALAWRHRAAPLTRVIVAAVVLASAAWAYVLLDRTPSWEPWLRPVILVLAIAGAASLLGGLVWRTLDRRLVPVGVALAIAACVAAPAAYSLQTITTAHTGSVPSAGPSTGSAFGGPGGSGRGFGGPGGSRAGLGGPRGRPGGPSNGGAGRGDITVNAALKTALEASSGKYRWVAATNGSQSAASLELATGGAPVMAIGGFNGQGGNLSLAQFEAYVKAGDVHYYIAGGGGGGPAGGGSTSSITSWVESHYKAVTIGGQTLYDLTQAKS
jgi:4-amino-4-deoxy-L-arabinose transferase-like glycosyltransferase